MTFLLTAQSWEQKDGIVQQLGQLLAGYRRSQHQTAEVVSRNINVSLNTIEGIERGDIQGRGATFFHYLHYADYLGMSLRHLFQAISPPNDSGATTHVFLHNERGDILERVDALLLRQFNQAIQYLQTHKLPVTQHAIGTVVQMTPQGLKRYPRVRAFLEKLAADHRYEHQHKTCVREEELLCQVTETAVRLRQLKQPITQRAIGRFLGIPWSTLRSYDRVQELLQEITKG